MVVVVVVVVGDTLGVLPGLLIFNKEKTNTCGLTKQPKMVPKWLKIAYCISFAPTFCISRFSQQWFLELPRRKKKFKGDEDNYLRSKMIPWWHGKVTENQSNSIFFLSHHYWDSINQQHMDCFFSLSHKWWLIRSYHH